MSGTTLDGEDVSTPEAGASADLPEELTEGEEDQLPLSLDLVFELLRVSRRRETLWYLEENGGTARLDELAEHIAAKENDCEVAELSSSQRKRVYIGLYQCHLPKLDDADVIDYNQDRGTMELLPAAQQLYPYLTLDPFDPHQDDGGTIQRVLSVIRS